MQGKNLRARKMLVHLKNPANLICRLLEYICGDYFLLSVMLNWIEASTGVLDPPSVLTSSQSLFSKILLWRIRDLNKTPGIRLKLKGKLKTQLSFINTYVDRYCTILNFELKIPFTLKFEKRIDKNVDINAGVNFLVSLFLSCRGIMLATLKCTSCKHDVTPPPGKRRKSSSFFSKWRDIRPIRWITPIGQNQPSMNRIQ